jgi:hypothetical protein
MDERREVLVNRMRHLREVIREWFAAIDDWHATHPEEPPPDMAELDPGDYMTRMAAALDASLAREAAIEAGTWRGDDAHDN